MRPSDSRSSGEGEAVRKAEELVTESSMTANIEKVASVKNKVLKDFYSALLVNLNTDESYTIQQISDVIVRSNDAPYIGHSRDDILRAS